MLAMDEGNKKKGEETTNAEFASMYGGDNYDDMVTTEEYNEYSEQGDSITPREMEAIQQTIEEYSGDFEHCLANHFFFAAAVLSGGSYRWQSLLKNLALSTAGNAIGAGAIAGWLLPWACGPDPIVR